MEILQIKILFRVKISSHLNENLIKNIKRKKIQIVIRITPALKITPPMQVLRLTLPLIEKANLILKKSNIQKFKIKLQTKSGMTNMIEKLSKEKARKL